MIGLGYLGDNARCDEGSNAGQPIAPSEGAAPRAERIVHSGGPTWGWAVHNKKYLDSDYEEADTKLILHYMPQTVEQQHRDLLP